MRISSVVFVWIDWHSGMMLPKFKIEKLCGRQQLRFTVRSTPAFPWKDYVKCTKSSESIAGFLTEIATRHSIIHSRCAKHCTTAVDLVVC